MRRRQFLPALAAGLVPLTGCSSRPLTTHLHDPRVETDDRSAMFTWFGGGGSVTLRLQNNGSVGDTAARYSLDVWHANRLRVDAFRYRLRLPSSGADVPTRIYLKRPNGNSLPQLTFEQGQGASTILAAKKLGALGSGTFSVDLIFDSVGGELPERLSLSARLELSDQRPFAGAVDPRTFVAETSTTIELP